MKDDVVVTAVRSAREEYAATFNYDLVAMIDDARRKTEAAKQAGRPVAGFEPRPPRPAPIKASA